MRPNQYTRVRSAQRRLDEEWPLQEMNEQLGYDPPGIDDAEEAQERLAGLGHSVRV